MAEPAALRGPDEATVLQEAQVVVQVHPGLGLLRKQQLAAPIVDVVAPQLQAALVTRLDLHSQAAIRSPVHARKVDVGVRAQIEPARWAALQRNDAEAHARIGAAGKWIAVLLHAPGVALVHNWVDRNR